jgi:signal transduction histidine kinase
VLNLILNAVAASPDGSEVHVSAEATLETLVITVVDRGPGLPALAAKVLTGRPDTRPPLDGGGLGLWTIGRLVADIGGNIVVEYPAVGGTSVTLNIPIAQMELSYAA